MMRAYSDQICEADTFDLSDDDLEPDDDECESGADEDDDENDLEFL